MKKLLKTLVALTITASPIITTANLSINTKVENNVNHHLQNLQMIAKPLFRTTNNDIKLTLTLGATYGEINKAIYNTADDFKKHPLTAGYQVDYYRNDGDENNINDEAQMAGDVYVVITAFPHDPYWKGKTKYLKVTIQKDTLNNITTFTDLPSIQVNNTKKYSEIDINIFNEAKQFAINKLAAGFTVNYYSDEKGESLVDSDLQKVGDVWVRITAAENDRYWTGTTAIIKITLISDKSSLSTITNLEEMPEIDIDFNKKNREIDINIFNKAKQFAINKLAAGFTVNYFSDEEGKEVADDKEQVGGNVWVRITAADNDLNWFGTSYPLKLTLTDNRPDLNIINDLSGMDPIIVNPNLTYQEINKNIVNTSNQLKSDPLTGNFTIQYFSDKLGKHIINNYYQQIGTVYVIIIPDFHTGTKWKTNKIPIAFTIEK